MWTPRSTHIGVLSPTREDKGSPKRELYPLPRKTKFTFKPKAPIDYKPPPPASNNTKQQGSAIKPVTAASELDQQAEQLLEEALQLDQEALAASSSPPLAMQLGLLVLCKEDFIKKSCAIWDTRGRGEFVKGEFRINLRKVGLDPSAVDADNLVRAALP